LIDSDGQPVMLDTGSGVQRVEAGGEFTVARPENVKPGTPLDTTMAFNFGALPLPPGGRYVWRFSVDGESDEDWQLAFTVRPLQA